MKPLFFLCALAACHDSTGGHVISLPMTAAGFAHDTTQPVTFMTKYGWTVTLDKALAVLGPFYFNIQGATADFRSGTVILQGTEQVVIDTLDPTPMTVTGGVDGETGVAKAVEIDLYTSDHQYNAITQLAAPLNVAGGGTAYIAGTATKGGATIAFAGVVVIDDNAVQPSLPLEEVASVEGANCNLDFTTSTKSVSLVVDPRPWFDFEANFCDLVPPTASGELCQPDPSQVYSWTSSDKSPSSAFNSAVLSGIRSNTAVYTFSID